MFAVTPQHSWLVKPHFPTLTNRRTIFRRREKYNSVVSLKVAKYSIAKFSPLNGIKPAP